MSSFVAVESGSFMRYGAPYRYFGTNMWQAAWLEPDRLSRELQRLQVRQEPYSAAKPYSMLICCGSLPIACPPTTQDLGVTNVRIMAASEGGVGRSAHVQPPMQPELGVYDEDVLRGLDRAVQQIGAHGMTAVLTLGNMWQWSGGFASYVGWVTGEQPPRMTADALDRDWQLHQNFASEFYGTPGAVGAWRAYVTTLLSRTNTASGVAYAADPTILSWQLCNEPRPLTHTAAYLSWIEASAALVRSLAPRQLVSLGSEGPTPWPSYTNTNAKRDHAHVDYVGVHVWPQNWQWYDPAANSLQMGGGGGGGGQHGGGNGAAAAATHDISAALSKAQRYVEAAHAAARSLNKPLVVDEFGLARDGGSLDPAASNTSRRDAFFGAMCEHLVSLGDGASEVAGLNFWAWSGEARPVGRLHSEGDDWLGDPPHEPQGWYGVYDTDAGTAGVIRRCARLFAPALPPSAPAPSSSSSSSSSGVESSPLPAPPPAPRVPRVDTPGWCAGVWPDGGFDAERDLISLHYDCSADPDDFMSAVADRALLERSYGGRGGGTAWLRAHVVPVAGTYGTNTDYQQQGCEATMHATWGDATGYLRASTRDPPRAERTAALRRAAAVEAAARWLAAIERGGQVYVKEGGQSDFTLAVLDEVELYWQGAAGCVHVVQHSQWNEQTTSAGVLDALRARGIDYVGNAKSGSGPVADGNGPLMRLRRTYRPKSGAHFLSDFVATATASWLGCAWRVAFDEFAKVPSWCDWRSGRAQLFSAEECLDFSDTHELLIILRVVAPDADSFTAEDFLEQILLPSTTRTDAALPAATCNASLPQGTLAPMPPRVPPLPPPQRQRYAPPPPPPAPPSPAPRTLTSSPPPAATLPRPPPSSHAPPVTERAQVGDATAGGAADEGAPQGAPTGVDEYAVPLAVLLLLVGVSCGGRQRRAAWGRRRLRLRGLLTRIAPAAGPSEAEVSVFHSDTADAGGNGERGDDAAKATTTTAAAGAATAAATTTTHEEEVEDGDAEEPDGDEGDAGGRKNKQRKKKWRGKGGAFEAHVNYADTLD